MSAQCQTGRIGPNETRLCPFSVRKKSQLTYRNKQRPVRAQLSDFAIERSKRADRVQGKSSAASVITAKYDGRVVAEDEVLQAQIVHYFPAGDNRDNKTEDDPGEVPQYLFKSLNSAAEDIAAPNEVTSQRVRKMPGPPHRLASASAFRILSSPPIL